MSMIVAACRSPVAPRGGALAALDLPALGAPVLRAALADAGLAVDDVDEVIVSNALGAGGNPARSMVLAAGLPWRVAGVTLDRQCAGGLDAILLADALVRARVYRVVIAGGVESYSRRPLRQRTFADGRPPEPYDQAPFTPWPDRDPDMAQAADALATRLGIDRTAQEGWAIDSHARARATPAAGLVAVAGLDHDPFTRTLTARLCARAPVVSGTITAATMAVAADGAAFAVVMSADEARRRGLDGVRIRAGVTLGDDPLLPGLAPLPAIRAALAAAGLAPSDLRRAEIMEAFAVQAMACVAGAGLAAAIVNPGGGALARGHPVGASGAILAVDLFHALRLTGGAGLAAIAAAGGLGSALVLGD